jgi:hypothetical protein
VGGRAIDEELVPGRILKAISMTIELPSRFLEGGAGTDKRIE